MRQVAKSMELVRYGNLATMAAFTKGQAERLHLDLHDEPGLLVTLLVLG